MPEIRFQIIIPTKGGRELYLPWAIRSCLDQEHQNFEVLVSNNGGAPAVRDIVNSLRDSRIRYIETDRVLPMAVHWEFAVSQAKADVLTIIGDDDALMPHALARLNTIFMRHDELECVTHNPGQYYWPDYFDYSYRNLYLLKQGTGTLELLDTSSVLKLVAEFREWYGRLPLLYHGFVKRSVLDRIRDSQGKIFKRIIPDVYSDLVLAAVLDRYAHFDGCLTFGGQGAKSNGANFYLNNEEGKQFVTDLPDYLIPKYYPGNVHIQLYEYVEKIGDLFPEIRKDMNVAWMKFAWQVMLEALTTPAHCQCSLRELYRIALNDFPAVQRILTLIAIAPFRLQWMSGMAGNVLLRRRTWRMQNVLKDAVKTYGAHNIYELVTCIEG
jgi:glycosyltransferase involved in cell wall biosynthesis